MPYKFVCAGLLAAICGAALAGPAPWYQWRSKTVPGLYVCRQTLGPGWERAMGPYKDSHCEKLALAK